MGAWSKLCHNQNSAKVTAKVDFKATAKIEPIESPGVGEGRKITVYPTCNPKCAYFPYVDGSRVIYETDEFGVKHAISAPIFCGYDGHQIKDWKEACPLYLSKTLK